MALPAHQRPRGGQHRPLPVLHEGAEGARHRRLLQDPQRHRRRSSTAWTCIYQGVVDGRDLARALGGAVLRPRRRGCSASTRARACIAPGSDADIVVYDPNGHDDASASTTHHMNMDYSAYEGTVVQGRVDTVLSRGTVVVDDGEYLGTQGPRPLPAPRRMRVPRSEASDAMRQHDDRSSTGSAASAFPSTSGRTAPVYDPATGEQQAEVGLASRRRGRRRSRGRGATRSVAWRRASLSRRRRGDVPLPRAARRAPRRDRGRGLTAEHGKVRSDAAGEVARGLENVEFACGIPALLKGGYSEQASTGVDVYSVRQPLGVVAGITPFNFPAMVPLWMFANADRVRQHVRAQAVREGSVGVAAPRRAVGGGRPARRRLQRRAGRHGRGRTGSSSIPTSPR